MVTVANLAYAANAATEDSLPTAFMQPRTVLLMRAFTLACIMAAAALCGAFAYVLLRAADVGRVRTRQEP